MTMENKKERKKRHPETLRKYLIAVKLSGDEMLNLQKMAKKSTNGDISKLVRSKVFTPDPNTV